MSETTAYRLVEMKNGLPHTLFHGLPNGAKRSRRLPLDTWIDAEVKPVSYGRSSPFMESGFNVLLEESLAHEYLRRFTADRRIKVVYCFAKGLRPKPNANSPVYLANSLMIPSEQFSCTTI